MQVLLVQPWNTAYDAPVPAENLGLGYLAANLRQNGIEVEILDGLILRLTPAQLTDQIVQRDPTLVGISVHGQALAEATWRMAEIARAKGSQAHICLGGMFPSVEHTRILNCMPQIDSVVRGEGEHTFLQLAQHILNGESLTGVEGVTYRSPAGKVVANPARERILDLDKLPFPARDTLPLVLKIVQSVQVQAGRGCSHSRCAFCSIAAVYGFKPKVVLRRPELVVEEIARVIKEHGCWYFHFSDDNFVDQSDESRQWATAFCREIARRNIKISFRINLRADCTDRKIMADLRKAGLWEASIGVETNSQHVLNHYAKGTRTTDNTRARDVLESLGIKFKPNLILFDPYATWAEMKSTAQYMRQNRIHSLKGLYRVLLPYAGTLVREHMIRDGLLEERSFWHLTPYQFKDPRVAQLHALTTQLGRHITALNHDISEIKHRWIWQLGEFNQVFDIPLTAPLQALLADMEHYNQRVESWVIGFIWELIRLVETEQSDLLADIMQRHQFTEHIQEFQEEAKQIRKRAIQLADPVLKQKASHVDSTTKRSNALT